MKRHILQDLGSNFSLCTVTLAFSLAFFLRKLKIYITRCLAYPKMGNTTRVSDPKFHHNMTP